MHYLPCLLYDLVRCIYSVLTIRIFVVQTGITHCNIDDAGCLLMLYLIPYLMVTGLLSGKAPKKRLDQNWQAVRNGDPDVTRIHFV